MSNKILIDESNVDFFFAVGTKARKAWEDVQEINSQDFSFKSYYFYCPETHAYEAVISFDNGSFIVINENDVVDGDETQYNKVENVIYPEQWSNREN